MKDIEPFAEALADLAMKCAGGNAGKAVFALIDAAACLNAAAGGDSHEVQAYFDSSMDEAAEVVSGGAK